MNVIRFKLGIVKIVNQNPPENKSQDAYELIITHKPLKLTYYQELRERFVILAKTLDLLPESFTPQFAQTLTKAFLINNVSANEKFIYFELLNALIESNLSLISLQSFSEFFYEVLLKLVISQYTKHTFGCFKKLFILFNVYYNHIDLYGEVIEITNGRLLGLNHLWRIVFYANEETYPIAAEFLMEIYKSFSLSIIHREGQNIRESFIEECMKNLKEDSTAFRAIELLNKYMECFEIKNKSYEKSMFGSNDRIVINIRLFISNNPYQCQITVNPNEDTLDSLLRQILNKVNYDGEPSTYIFISSVGILKPSSQKIAQTDLKDGSDIMVEFATLNTLNKLKEMFTGKNEKILAAALVQGNGDVSTAAEILSNERNIKEIEDKIIESGQEKLSRSYEDVADPMSKIFIKNTSYFNNLYSCLKLPSEKVQLKALEFLKKIEFPEHILRYITIELLDEDKNIDWTKIFPINSIHELEYFLLILKYILKRTFGEYSYDTKLLDNEQRVKWVDIFVNKGGYEHLLKLCFETDWKGFYEYEETLLLIIKEITIQALMNLDRSSTKRFLSLIDRRGFDYFQVDSKKFSLLINYHTDTASLVKCLINSYGLISKLVNILKKFGTNDNLDEFGLLIFENSLILLGVILSQDQNCYEEIYKEGIFFELGPESL